MSLRIPSSIKLDPEAMDKYILSPIPLHQLANVCPEEADPDNDLDTPDVGRGICLPPHSLKPPNVVETLPDPLTVLKTPHTPPPLPLLVELPATAQSDVCHAGRVVKLSARLQDYSLW